MPPDGYDFWLFDLDGTLVDVDWSYVRTVYDRVSERIDRTFTDREALELWHGLGGARDPQLREWGLDPTEFWPALHAVEDPQSRATATYLYDDADALLRAIEGDAPVGVVTHCAEFLADPVVEGLGLADRVDAVVYCTDETGWKPDPRPVRLAMEDLHVADEAHGVLVGDSPSDVGAAWNAGLDAVHVERHGHDSRGRCVLADHRVGSLADLPVGALDATDAGSGRPTGAERPASTPQVAADDD